MFVGDSIPHTNAQKRSLCVFCVTTILGWLATSFPQAAVCVPHRRSTSTTSQHGQWVLNTFRTNTSLYHLALDEILNKVYVGGADRIYQLDTNLHLEVEAISGPDRSDNKTNHNKILLVFEQHLLTCGTGYQGTCQTRELRNISNATTYPIDLNTRVSATGKNLTTVAFVANAGPFRLENTEVLKEQSALYVGMSYTGMSELPSVCSRQLIDDRSKFQIFKTSMHEFVRPYVKVNPELKGGPPIIYFKTGFSHEGFSYFLTVQGDRKQYSRLIRICQHDSLYSSYIEVDLKCTSASGQVYTQVQDAHLLKAGSYLSSRVQQTKIKSKTRKDEFVLLAVFSNGFTDSRAESALCVYPMADVQHKIIENIVLCYNGTPGNFKPNHLEVQSKFRVKEQGCVPMGEEVGHYHRHGPLHSRLSK